MNKNRGGIYIKITGESMPVWYAGMTGQVFRVNRRPVRYYGGLGYKCLDRLGGILVKDCVIVENMGGQ